LRRHGRAASGSRGSSLAAGVSRGPLAAFGRACVLVLGLLSILGLQSASASTTYTYDHTISTSQPYPNSVAVNQETGDLYVTFLEPYFQGYAIERFDSTGAPKEFTEIGSNLFELQSIFRHGDPIAVDSSGGGIDGAFFTPGYVAFGKGFYGFLSTGEGLGANFNSSGVGNYPQDGEVCGLATAGSSLYVGRAHGTVPLHAGAYVDRYRLPTGDQPIEEWAPRSTFWDLTIGMAGAEEPATCSFAADTTGTLYYVPRFGLLSPGVLRRYDVGMADVKSEDDTKTIAGKLIDQETYAVNVDPTTHQVFADEGNQIARYSSDGELQEKFGLGNIGFSFGVAVDSQSGAVYVGDALAGIHVFLPVPTPDATTLEATDVGQTTATVNGHVDPAGNGPITDCHFEIGTETSYGEIVPCAQATPIAVGADVSADLSGLALDTTYHYRLVTSNANGTPHFGFDQTVTPRAVLYLSTDPPSDVSQTMATLNGSFTGNGEDTAYYFEWGEDESYGEVTSAPPGEGAGSPLTRTQVSSTVSGLAPYTLYHYRVVATNGVGTTYGLDQTFYAAPPFLPTIANVSVEQSTPTTARLSATVNPGLGATTYRFQYGETSQYALGTPMSESIGSDLTDHVVESELAGLRPDTTYHFRAVAVNLTGTTHSLDQTFRTPSRPRIGRVSVSDIGERTALLYAQVGPGSSSTTYRFDYGTGPSYGSAALYGLSTPESAPIGSDAVDHDVTAALSGLSPGTTYHYRVVATNAFGTTAGEDQTFATNVSATPTPPTKKPKCRRGFIRRHGKCVKRKRRLSKHRHRRHQRERHHKRGAR
jgi:phosphodiesterase/alkaline phosphatase D-like protein